MTNIEEVIGDYKKLIGDVYENLKEIGIDVSAFPIDHIGYRTTTRKKYETLRNKLNYFGDLVSEIIIRNRPIAIFKLKESLIYKDIKIPFFEILAPAKGDTVEDGLEHAEFVIGTQLLAMTNKYPKVNFFLNDKKINPELILKFSNGANVKFHQQPIDEVIKLEKNQS